jgi:hypothetical protein
MKRIISSLVFSVALLGTVVAQEAQNPVTKPAVKQNKLVALVKKYPKTTAALVATVLTAGGVGATYYFKPELVKQYYAQVTAALTTAKDSVLAAPGQTWAFTKKTVGEHPYIVGGSVAGLTAVGLIAADLARGEKSIIKKTLRNRKAAAQQA